MPAQDENLRRVSDRIAGSILEFLEGNITFHADDLRNYVTEKVGVVAPGSADRVLRLLRQKGRVDYIVLNRRESLYQRRTSEEQLGLL